MLFPLEYKRYLKEVLPVLTKAFSEYFALSVSEKLLARPTFITMEQHIKMKIMFNFYTFHIRLFDKKFHPEKLNLIYHCDKIPSKKIWVHSNNEGDPEYYIIA